MSHLDTLWRAMDGQWLDYDGGGTIAKKSEGDPGLDKLLVDRGEQKKTVPISVNCAGQFPNRSVDDDDADLQKLLAHRGEETQTLHLSIPQNCSTVKILNRSDANLENRGKYCHLL